MAAQDRDSDRDGDLDSRQRQLRRRNLVMLAVLAGLAVLFYVITIVKMGGGG
jgi:hypothetical protein